MTSPSRGGEACLRNIEHAFVRASKITIGFQRDLDERRILESAWTCRPNVNLIRTRPDLDRKTPDKPVEASPGERSFAGKYRGRISECGREGNVTAGLSGSFGGAAVRGHQHRDTIARL